MDFRLEFPVRARSSAAKWGKWLANGNVSTAASGASTRTIRGPAANPAPQCVTFRSNSCTVGDGPAAGDREANFLWMPDGQYETRTIMHGHEKDRPRVGSQPVQQRWMGAVERCGRKTKARWDVEGCFVATDAEEWKEGLRPRAGTPWHGIFDLQR